jgi:DNA-directed RNA polymerase specialized sigma24 family protein
MVRPIDQLTAEWAVTGSTAEARKAIEALSRAEPLVDAIGAYDLGQLVTALRAADAPTSRAHSAQLLRAMLRSQSVHPLIPRAILQALLPGLVSVARRLSWGSGGDWTDGGAFFADILATAWEVITAWSGDDRQYAVLDLLSAVRCRVRRQLIRDRTARSALPAVDLESTVTQHAGPGSTALDDLARLLDEPRGNGLDPTDAAVMYATRVLGLSLAELARMSGRSRRHLAARRQRAERELCG